MKQNYQKTIEKACCFFAAATAIPLVASSAFAVLIDFESFPGPDGKLGTADDVPVANQDIISNQFVSLGVTFELADGTAPIVRSPINYLPEGPHSIDTVLLPKNNMYSGEQDIQDVIINFTNPVNAVGITSLDTDEWWTLRAYNAAGVEIAAASPDPLDMSDRAVTAVEVDVDGSDGFISKVVLDVSETNSCCGGGPEHFDDLSFNPINQVTGIILTRNWEPYRDQAQFKLKELPGVIAGFCDNSGDFTIAFGPVVGGPIYSYTGGNIPNDMDCHCNGAEECVVNIRNANFDNAALNTMLTGEMSVTLEVNGITYSNTGTWTQYDSGNGSWTKYRKDN